MNRGISLSRRLLSPRVLQRRGIVSQVSPELNSFGLRKKVHHLLLMKTPDEAEKILKKSNLEGSEYSWNLLIKYHAKSGDYKQAESTYQQVCPFVF
jgi:pentatricopeptide repeat protein